MEGFPVKVYIYDLSKGLARAMSYSFLGRQIDGIWHTGIVAYGEEYYFGGMGGIESCPPSGTILGPPDQIHDLGMTQIPKEVFMEYLRELSSSTFRGECYHLLDHNCNTFSNEVAQFLTGNPIPSQITSLPGDVLSTPFGSMIRPFIDSMSVSPGGGHAVFPDQSQRAAPSPGPIQGTAPSAASQPTQAKNEGGKSQAVASSDSEKPTKNDDPLPVVYRDSKVLDASDWQSTLADRVTKQELDTVNEITEFLSIQNPQWSLGKKHIDILCRLINNTGISEELHIVMYQLLQQAVLNEEIVNMMSHYSSHPVMEIATAHDSSSTKILLEIGKLLANFSSTKDGANYVVSMKQHSKDSLLTNCKIIGQTCAACLLHGDKDVQGVGVALTSNLARHSVPEDMAVEIGSALLQWLSTEEDIGDEAAFQSLTSLNKLCQVSQEVAQLCTVMGLNVEKYKKTEKLSKVCIQLQQLFTSI